MISTRYGYGTFLHLHPNLNTRTRCLTTETRDLKCTPSQSSGLRFPFERNYPDPNPCPYPESAPRFRLLLIQHAEIGEPKREDQQRDP